MQTFLPYPDFNASAECLDYRRLGKQRVEAMQIVNTLEGKSEGWKNHPAVRMWVGYTDALKYYCNCMIAEWESRGYKNNMERYWVPVDFNLPPWIGGEIHASHRARLLEKDPSWYGQFNWSETASTTYHWPV